MRKAKVFYIISLFVFILIGQVYGQIDEGFKYNVGDELPNITMKDYEGKTFNIDDLKGKPFIINMFATWCVPCIKEMNYLAKEISSKYDQSKIEIVSVGYEHIPLEIEYFLEDHDFEFTFIPDFEKKIYLELATTGVPRCIVVDKNGIIVAQKAGFKEEEFNPIIDRVHSIILD